MLQVYEALIETSLRFGREYGPPVALAVLAFTACGIFLRVVASLRPRDRL